jgi:hypothetical protein
MAIRQVFPASPQYIRRKFLRRPVALEGLRTPLALRNFLCGRGMDLHLLAAEQLAPLGILELLPPNGIPGRRARCLDTCTRQAGSSVLRLEVGPRFHEFPEKLCPLELIGCLIRPSACANRRQQDQAPASHPASLSRNIYHNKLLVFI